MGKGKRKKKTEQINVTEFMGSEITKMYLLVMFGLFPVFYPGHLIGIHSMKYNFFVAVSGVFLCLMLIVLIRNCISCAKEHRKFQFDRNDIFVFLFLTAAVVSTFVGYNMESAFYGNDRIKTGSLILILCVLSFYAVKRYGRFNEKLIRINLLASGFIYLSGIFITCKTDILNMQKDIVQEQRGIFVSPIGNINYNVSYISLMLPAAMVLYLIYKEALMKRVIAVYLYIGFMDMICLRAESGVVLLVFAFAFLLYFALEKTDWFVKYLSVAQIFFAANISVYLLKLVLKDHMYDFDGLNALLLRTEVIVAELVLIAFLFLLQKKVKTVREECMVRLQKVYKFGMLILLAAVIAFVLVLNFFFREAASGNGLDGLILKDTTGSLRGYIWTRTVKVFSEMPIVNKIFGCGLGCFYDFIYPAYGTDMVERFNSIFYDPHNDFLHVLSTTGIVGAIGFFGGIFSAISYSVKRRKNREMQMIVIMTLASFLVQGLVNSFTIFVIPLVFIIMGMAYSSPEEVS